MRFEDFEYELIEEGVRITSYGGYDEMLGIPAEIDGKPVVEIGEDCFSDNGMFLMSVFVPPTVKRICRGAFRTCVCLTELRLSEGVEVIEMEALYLTPLESLVLPNTLQRLDMPWELSGLRLFMEDDHPCFYTDGIGVYRKDGDERILLVATQVEEYDSYTVLDGTTIIGESAFAGNPVKSIILPDTVHTISNSAMESCDGLCEIDLPEGLRVIGAHAFSRCIGLKSLHLPASLERIDDHGVSDTFGWSESLNGIEQITVAPGNPYFMADDDVLLFRKGDEYALIKYYGHHHRYDIPDGITTIRMSAFRRCDAREIGIPGSVCHVETDAFKECKLLEWFYLEETGTKLYIPRNPIYRKDEIVALLDCPEEDRPNPITAEDLPERWKKFGHLPISGKRERIKPRENKYLFDYVGYDGLFHTYLNITDHIGMACCRLKYPVDLDDHVVTGYRDFITGNWPEVLDDIAVREDMDQLSDLADLEFFTDWNIEDVMDVFNRAGKTKLLGFLMNYKNEHFDDTSFDFSL